MKNEPVAILDIVKYVVAALASYGVITIPDGMTDSIIIVAAGLINAALTLFTRSRVTPVAETPTL